MTIRPRAQTLLRTLRQARPDGRGRSGSVARSLRSVLSALAPPMRARVLSQEAARQAFLSGDASRRIPHGIGWRLSQGAAMVARSERSDFELLDAWSGGDDRAGSELLHRHFDALFRFFASKVSHGVEDLIQQTLLASVRGKEQFRRESSFKTYLFAIARHELYRQFRKQKREGEIFDPGSHSVCDLGPSPSFVVARRKEYKGLLSAIRQLPLDLQIALELFYWEDMRGEELSRVLDIPLGTVKSRLRRAKEGLRKVLAEQAAGKAPPVGDEGIELSDGEGTEADFDAWIGSLKPPEFTPIPD